MRFAIRLARYAHTPLATAAVLAFAAGSLAAQTTAVGLSTVRAQRFGNENLLGFYTPQGGDGFGVAVATGDFNGDGATDLATDIPLDNGIAGSEIEDSGTVIVRYGHLGSGLDTSLASTVLRQGSRPDPAEVDDAFGSSLASCDFNGDAFDDLAVGVPGEDYLGRRNAGAVQIHYGTGSGLPTLGDVFITESTPGISGDVETDDQFASSLACGDFDRDGFDDLAVGVPLEAWGVDQAEGMVVVIPGSIVGLVPAASTSFTQDSPGMHGGAESYDEFGFSLAAGDFNGDAFDDLAIGVPQEDFEGQLQVVFGGPTGLTSAGNIFWSETFIGGLSEQRDLFSYSLAAADFDGDGFEDLAIGIPDESLGSGESILYAGQVNVLYGAADGFDRSRTQFFDQDDVLGSGTSETGDEFGSPLAAGDFDHDGRADLVIGTPHEQIGGPKDGAATVLMGSPKGLTADRHRMIAAGVEGFPGDLLQHNKDFAYSLATGDFDGDGHDDLVLGSPLEDAGGIADVGAETVLYGALFADGAENGSTTMWSQNVSSVYFNKIRATAAAKLGPPESKVGLQVDLFAPSIQRPATPAYVRVGPEAGFANERHLSGTFFVDPQPLTMSSAAGFNVFQMLVFNDALSPAGKTRLRFDIVRTATDWAIVADTFDESLGALTFAASGLIAHAGDPNGHNTRFDFDWRAGSPGHLTMWRTHLDAGAPDRNQKIQFVSVDLPNAGNAVINQVLAGMVSGQRTGTYGSFYLDELSFRR